MVATGMITGRSAPASDSAPNHPAGACVALACLLPLLVGGSADAASYSLTVLGTLRADSTGASAATGINNAGLVVGWATTDGGGDHVFRWASSGGMTDAGSLVPPFFCAATDVNSVGQLCGFGLTQSSGFATALHQDAGGAILALPKPPGAGDSYGYGISDTGAIVGWTNLASGCGPPSCPSNPGHAMRWDGATSVFLPDLGGYYSVASGISSDGTKMCGYGADASGRIRGFRLQGTILDELPPLAGFSESYAEAVNDVGDVVGYCATANQDRATLWVGTSAVDLGVPAGALGSIALGINAPGAIVGYSRLAGDETLAVLFSASAPPQDLNALIPAGSGYTLTHADEINDVGQIVGDALLATFSRAMLLTPESVSAVALPFSREGDLALAAPWPNPAKAGTTLHYVLPATGSAQLVVVDVAGREVTRLLDEVQTVGEHTRAWNGRDSEGRLVRSGVYFVRLQAGGASQSRKIVVAR